jgi:saccharopine dehydrogenase-like NADP-dependent oxidoreductase
MHTAQSEKRQYEREADSGVGGLLRVFLLGGAGLVGQYTARNFAANATVSEITIAGRNLEKTRQAASALGEKGNSIKADATDEKGLARLVAGYDILVNTSGPDYVVQPPAVRAAIRSGVHYCDVSCDGPAAEKVLRLRNKAEAAGITAIIGIGWGPGLDNLMMVHAARQLDRADAVNTCMALTMTDLVSGDTNKIAAELRDSGPFSASWETFMRLYSGQCKIFRDKRWVTVDPFESGVVTANPKGGTVKLYPACGPQTITVPRSVPGLRDASVLISYFPLPLNELAHKLASRIKAGEISTKEAALSLIETAGSEREGWTLTPQEFPEDLWITASGIKDGARVRYTLVPTPGWMSTAGPLYTAAMMLLNGKIKEHGIFPPEACLEPIPFMEEVASIVPGRPAGAKLFEESFENLD